MGLDPREIREKLKERLKSEGRFDLASKLTKCAEIVPMQCVCCRSPVLVERGCARRWCPMCAPRITAKRLQKLSRIIPRIQWPLAVTLTIKNRHDGTDCIEKLKEAFRKFRRTDFWAEKVKGGIVGFEVTHRGRGWHPHLHALVDCRWLAIDTPEPNRYMSKRQKENLCKRAQNELSEVWGAYVQGSKASVWANRAYGKAAAETIKYAIKPSDLLECKCDAGEMIDEIDKGRMIGTFGSCHACSKDFVGLEEEVLKERECIDCQAKKSIVPNDALVRMMERPKKLSAHWREHLHTRMIRLGVEEGSEEMKDALGEDYDWWNDE